MKNTTRIAIAGLLTSLSGVLAAFASEFNSEAPASPESAAAPETPKPVKTKKEKPAAAVEEKPAETVETVEEVVTEEPAAGGKTMQDMQKIFDPLVKDGRGLEVKKEIAKFSPSGKLADMDPKHYAAFEKNIDALKY